MPHIEFNKADVAKARVLAAKLRAAEADLKPEVGKALSSGARSLPLDAQISALQNLPRRGGLNRLVARSRFRVRRTSTMQADVIASGIDQLSDINAGRVNHPTFGHHPRQTQRLPRARDWFSTPMHHGKDKISHAIGDAMHRVAKRITL